MAELSQKQTQAVHDALVDLGINYTELRLDLLDHLCCMIELEMDQNTGFEKALENALGSFGKQHLKETQEVTLYLLTLKTRIMKKVAAITGITASIFIIAGTTFKYFHLQGAGVLLVLGMALLSLLVLPLMGLADFNKQQDLKYRFTSLVGYFSGSVIFLGTLFKIMRWPYANGLLLGGFLAITLLFIPLYSVKSYQTAENKLMAVARSGIIMAAVVVLWGLFAR